MKCARNRHQFNLVQQKLKLFILMQDYVWMEFQLFIFGIWLLKCFIQINQRKSKIKDDETHRVTQHQTSTPKTKQRFQFIKTILNWVMLIMFRRARSLLNSTRYFTFLRTTKHRLKWSSKTEVQQWDTYPWPTELLLIDYLTESFWTSKSTNQMCWHQ